MNKLGQLNQTPERELINIFPKSYRLMVIASLAGGLVLLAMHWEKLIEDISYDLFFQIGVLFLIGLWLALSRVIVTTHRITHSFPLFKQEIAREHIEEIKIVPDRRAQMQKQLRARHPILMKPLFHGAKKKKLNTAQSLYFQHQQKNTSLMRMPLKTLDLNLFSSEQREDLLRYLKQDWGFACQQEDLFLPEIIQHEAIGQDIGQRCLYIIFGSIFLFIAMVFMTIYGHKAIHFGLESYLGFIPCLLIAFILTYPYIRNEAKAYPVVVAGVCSLILGAALYFSSLQVNRSFSEIHHQSLTATMQLQSYDREVQVWAFQPDMAAQLGIPHLYLSDRIKGYNPKLEAGKDYQITLKKGMLNDYFLDESSLNNIRLLNDR